MSDDVPIADHGLQAERTTMAWVRTALAIEATSVLAVRAMRAEPVALVLFASTSACLAAFMMTMLPRLHARSVLVMREGQTSWIAPCVLSGLVIATCLVTATMIALDR